MPQPSSILHCLLLSLLTCAVKGYNFDTAVPTIVVSGARSSGSGFGFSMTQHQFSDGRRVVLVGSPRLNGSDFHGNPVEEEGGVYSCPFDISQSCQVETVFQTKEDSNPLAEELSTLLSDDNRAYNGQLLGYSLRSFENYVVACAPLYVSRIQIIPIGGENHAYATPTGRCVVLNNDLSDASGDILQITNIDLKGGSLTLGGVDINIIEKEIGGGVTERIAIGSVFGGALTGHRPGQVVVTSLTPGSLGDLNVTASSESRPATEDGLLGYKIELGRFTEDVLQIATSAPRASRHHGQIRILNVPTDGTLAEVLTITGPEPDGYFGYDFVAHSFSEDGRYHSLIVGCPLCSNDRGSLFVYLHTGSLLQPFPTEPVQIPSPDVSVPGRFGTAVAVIGDSDGDGIADVAVSAPYAGERGVVYICRGFRGGLLPPTQAIPATPTARVFGYTLSGGLDIDNNGYPDLTVGDLDGTVTTLRASPLVTVVMEFEGLRSTLDLVDDRKCSVGNDITLLCFQVSPCFYYEALNSVDIAEFAFQYHLTVDGDRQASRVVLLAPSPSDTTYTIVTENSVSDNVTMTTGAGPGNRLCVGPFTFAIRADFVETTPIPVRLEVSESDAVPPLPGDSSTSILGGALTPVLRRYTEGEQLSVTSITREVDVSLNCSGGSGPACEPTYSISLSPSFDVNKPLLVAPGTLFGYDVTIENRATDDGLSPILVLDLGNGILLNGVVPRLAGDVAGCESTTSSKPQCLLRNPLHANSSISLTLSFRLNTSVIPLDTSSLPITISVVDGFTGNLTATITSQIALKAEASLGIGIILSDEQYQASRHALSRDTRTIPLNETGPAVRFSVLVSNSRESSNGTTIPSSTLVIHIPVAVQLDRNSTFQPLLVPYQFLSGSDDITCNNYGIIAEDLLSPIQRPANFYPPPGVGGPLGVDHFFLGRECEGQRGELGVRCGRIVCRVRDLEAGKPPSQVTVFAYLFSPSIIVRESYSIFAGVRSTTEGLVITDTETDSSSVSFEVLPSVIEVQLECFQYWIIAVSFVAGLLALFILIVALALCGVFGRWYRRKGDKSLGSSTETVDREPSHSGSTYAPRTIPPLLGVTGGGGVRGETGEVEKVDLEKEEEAERERQLEAEIVATAGPSSTEAGPAAVGDVDIDIPLEDLTFDPHLGVSEGGEETEI